MSKLIRGQALMEVVTRYDPRAFSFALRYPYNSNGLASKRACLLNCAYTLCTTDCNVTMGAGDAT
eukprot:5521630-Pyramimonas_sp.AAC.1